MTDDEKQKPKNNKIFRRTIISFAILAPAGLISLFNPAVAGFGLASKLAASLGQTLLTGASYWRFWIFIWCC